MILNKYSKWYFGIINNAKNRVLTGYCENHHILPKSIGGSNDPKNLVKLTAREHFICHYLLTKMTAGTDLMKMRKALRYMSCIPEKMNGLRYVPNSRIFEIVRKEAGLANVGNKEIAQKISASHKGKVLSEEHKLAISEGLKGTVKSKEASEKSRIAQQGKPKSHEHKQKLVRAWVARKERKKLGLEKRAKYSVEALCNFKISAKLRVQKEQNTRREFAFGFRINGSLKENKV